MDQFNQRQEFEVHVTVKPTENLQPFINICSQFTQYANGLGIPDTHVYSCKPIIIVLPEGTFKQQPMCSMFVSSTLQNAIRFGEIFAQYTTDNHKDYEFARNKVEARFRNVQGNLNLDIYKNNSFYWEFHFKLLLDRDEEKIAEFRTNLQKKFPFTRLSRSALSKHEVNGNVKTSRIVTLRLYSGDKLSAKQHFDSVEAYLLQSDLNNKYGLILKPGTELELSVYDTNVFHDTGWIDTTNQKDKTKAYPKRYSLVSFLKHLLNFFMFVLTYIYLYLN
jgi:hypothetical protein